MRVHVYLQRAQHAQHAQHALEQISVKSQHTTPRPRSALYIPASCIQFIGLFTRVRFTNTTTHQHAGCNNQPYLIHNGRVLSVMAQRFLKKKVSSVHSSQDTDTQPSKNEPRKVRYRYYHGTLPVKVEAPHTDPSISDDPQQQVESSTGQTRDDFRLVSIGRCTIGYLANQLVVPCRSSA